MNKWQALPIEEQQQLIRNISFQTGLSPNAVEKDWWVTATHYEEVTNSFFGLLHANIHVHRDAAFYAGQLCITARHLAKVIRHTTGQVPSYRYKRPYLLLNIIIP